jgi:hypothetical protein
MPHVPPELKERLKREVSVQRLAEARGVKLKRSGKELIGLCPFHKDSKPSLRIDPVENRWHCFGCDRKGDVIEWVNEDREQTRAIHQKQREAQTVEGMWAQDERRDILKLHRNAQRLLRPLRVANEQVKKHTFPDYVVRTRRDHMKFLTLVQTIALLYQHQREIKTETRKGKTLEYIEATAEDVALAWRLVSEVLAPSLDELPPQTRRLLLEIDKMVKEVGEQFGIERSEYRFSRATVRQYTHWSDSQLKRHLHRLEELEYLLVHRGARGQSFVYELHFELDENGKPVLPGLGYDYDKKEVRGKRVEVRVSGEEVCPKSGPSPGVFGTESLPWAISSLMRFDQLRRFCRWRP